MSMYYNFYLGYRDDNKRIVPLGPFNNEGKLKELFMYSHHYDISVHEDFYGLAWEDLSEEFKDVLGKDFYYSKDVTFKDVWKECQWGYLPLDKFINGVKSMQHFIKTGYWKIGEIESFLSLPEEERNDYLYNGNLPNPMPPDVYAARVAADPEVAKKYMFYAICDTNVDDYYRYLAHILSHRLIDDYKHEDREYVIFYYYA